MAKIANVALTNTFDTWRSRSNEAFDRLSQFAINNSSLYANTLTANSSFTSKGLATMQGRATVGTNLTVSGNTAVGGAGKTANVTGTFNVFGRATISTNLTVSGNTTFGPNILGLVNMAGRAVIGTNLTVSGNTTIGAAGKVFNSTGLHNHVGRQTISTNLYVAGNTVLGNANTVTDRTIINGVLVANGNLSVAGNTTIGAAGKTANVSGWFGVAGRASVSTNLFVGGNTTLNGTTIDKSDTLSQTLADGATINWDVALGRVATLTLGAAGRIMAAPTNLKVGTYILRVYQDGTGSRTITTWNSVFKWTAAVAPVLSTGANKLDIITFFSDGTNLYGSYLPDMR